MSTQVVQRVVGGVSKLFTHFSESEVEALLTKLLAKEGRTILSVRVRSSYHDMDGVSVWIEIEEPFQEKAKPPPPVILSDLERLSSDPFEDAKP